MTDCWRYFLEKHDRPRGEMDAGLLFGSIAAPEFRLREIIQVAYRLNLVRPESAFVHDTSSNCRFVAFFLAQMVPSLKSIRTLCGDGLETKYPGVSFAYSDCDSYDVLWGADASCVANLVGKITKGGVAIVENCCQLSNAQDFQKLARLGNSSEVIIDSSERDAIMSLHVNGNEAPKTKYAGFLCDREHANGFGVVYF